MDLDCHLLWFRSEPHLPTPSPFEWLRGSHAKRDGGEVENLDQDRLRRRAGLHIC